MSQPSEDEPDQRECHHHDANRRKKDQEMRKGRVEHAVRLPRQRSGGYLATPRVTILKRSRSAVTVRSRLQDQPEHGDPER